MKKFLIGLMLIVGLASCGRSKTDVSGAVSNVIRVVETDDYRVDKVVIDSASYIIISNGVSNNIIKQ